MCVCVSVCACVYNVRVSAGACLQQKVPYLNIKLPGLLFRYGKLTAHDNLFI